MKRIVLLAALALLNMDVFAQGTVTFNNTWRTPVVWGGGIGAGPKGAPVAREYGVQVGLYFYNGVQFQFVSRGASLGHPSDRENQLAGRFNAGTVTVPGLAAGSVGAFQVRAWSGGFPSYELAAAGGAPFLGVSPTFPNPSGGVIDPATGDQTLPAPLIGFTGMEVFGPIPEPSMLALAGMGLAVLGFFRWRRPTKGRVRSD